MTVGLDQRGLEQILGVGAVRGQRLGSAQERAAARTHVLAKRNALPDAHGPSTLKTRYSE
jgi:hypothetical protein